MPGHRRNWRAPWSPDCVPLSHLARGSARRHSSKQVRRPDQRPADDRQLPVRYPSHPVIEIAIYPDVVELAARNLQARYLNTVPDDATPLIVTGARHQKSAKRSKGRLSGSALVRRTAQW